MSYGSALTPGLLIEQAKFIVDNKATIRDTASYFGCSKTHLHERLVRNLPYIDYDLYLQVRHQLDINKSEKHSRGGRATANKFRKERIIYE